MVFVYDNLVECIAAVFGAGMALHFASSWAYRSSYGRLRNAYEVAVREVQRSGSHPAAVVRAHELHREFMRARPPNWAYGVGRATRRMLKLCAVVAFLAFVFERPILGPETHPKTAAAPRDVRAPR